MILVRLIAEAVRSSPKYSHRFEYVCITFPAQIRQEDSGTFQRFAAICIRIIRKTDRTPTNLVNVTVVKASSLCASFWELEPFCE